MTPQKSSASALDVNRRDFVKAGLLVGGGILLGAPAFLRAQTPKADALQVAIVGLGAQGRILLDAMLGIPGLNFRGSATSGSLAALTARTAC